MQKRRYSVDAICFYDIYAGHTLNGIPQPRYDKFATINRLSQPRGLALIGGGIERGEDREEAIVREVKEEVGLDFTVWFWLPKTYSTPGRDPRGPATSYVAVGRGVGEIQPETKKTEPFLLDAQELDRYASLFVFDHGDMIRDFRRLMAHMTIRDL